MEFCDYLLSQSALHPSMRPQDAVKMCYQAAYGAEHMISDTGAAEAYFKKEFSSSPYHGEPLFEMISPDVIRINLPAWKKEGLPPGWLFKMFLLSARKRSGGDEVFKKYLSETERLANAGKLPFSSPDFSDYIEKYKSAGGGAVHHSEEYRVREHPAYRIADAGFARLMPVFESMAAIAGEKAPHVVAIDGRAASGKTTAASLLSLVTGAGIIHMDDFFLPPGMRTQARLLEPGGNVHYERFAGEVLPLLKSPAPFSYRRFDCGIMDYSGLRNIVGEEWRIVEGAYSCHPYFGEYMDIRVFFDIKRNEQLSRIKKRDGKGVSAFVSRWIPMEESYIEKHHIREKAGLVI